MELGKKTVTFTPKESDSTQSIILEVERDIEKERQAQEEIRNRAEQIISIESTLKELEDLKNKQKSGLEQDAKKIDEDLKSQREAVKNHIERMFQKLGVSIKDNEKVEKFLRESKSIDDKQKGQIRDIFERFKKFRK